MNGTHLDVLIDRAAKALIASCPNENEDEDNCVEDEETCFRTRPVHFAWYQLGEYGVVGETKAIARVVIEAVREELLFAGGIVSETERGHR